MTATTVPQFGMPHEGGRRRRHRKDAHQLEVWFMTGERHGRGGHRRSRRGMHGPAGFGFGGPLGPGRRAGRGDIRAAILTLLAEEPMHGYQIIQVISERSGGNWTPSPGSVYPTLQQLEDEPLYDACKSKDDGEALEPPRAHELADAFFHAATVASAWPTRRHPAGRLSGLDERCVTIYRDTDTTKGTI